jgi:uncharacterized protein YkwD
MPRRIAGLGLALALAALAGGSPALAQDTCTNAGLIPGEGDLPAFNAAVVCLVNHERAMLGRAPLRSDFRLARAGRHQASDMVRREFFSHFTPEGADVVARVRRTGYIPRRRTWMVGEVLGWELFWASTPQAIVDAWMNSPPHRRALLEPRFRQIGAGAMVGTPVSADPEGVTAAVVLGRVGEDAAARSMRRPRGPLASRAGRPPSG